MVALASSTCPQQTAACFSKKCQWMSLPGEFQSCQLRISSLGTNGGAFQFEFCPRDLPWPPPIQRLRFLFSSLPPPFPEPEVLPGPTSEAPPELSTSRFIFSWGIGCVVLGSHPFPCYHHSPSQLYTPLPTSSSICFDALVMTCGLPHTTLPSS